MTTGALIVCFFFWNRKFILEKQVHMQDIACLKRVILQVSLGIATLLSVVWLPSGLLPHQTGAILLLTTVIWTTHEICYGSSESEEQPSMQQAQYF